MGHYVESMAYAGQVPWHGLGQPVSSDMTPHEMMVAAGLDWRVEKRPIFHKVNGGFEAIKDEYALVRDSDNSVLTLIGKKWKESQNSTAFEFFKKYTDAGHMKMETAGSLWNGRYVWALARFGMDFKLGKGSNADEVRGYLLFMEPHVFGKSRIIQFTPTRVVCWNTLTYAIGNSLKGGAGAFRMTHNNYFNEKAMNDAEATLGLATEQMQEFKEAATLLTAKKAPEKKVEEFFCEVLKYDPKEAKKKKTTGENKEPRMLPKFRQALTHAPGQQMPTALGTWWGAVNAVTYVVDHEVGLDRETALKAAWIGEKSIIKRRAVDLALKQAS